MPDRRELVGLADALEGMAGVGWVSVEEAMRMDASVARPVRRLANSVAGRPTGGPVVD